MVAITPQHAVTMTREQMEAHLTLHGWAPVNVGQGAAAQGERVVYAYDVHAPRFGESKVAVAIQTWRQLNLTGPARRGMSCWYMSDKYFWPLAHGCVKLDNQGRT